MDYNYENDQPPVIITFLGKYTVQARSHWVLVRPDAVKEVSDGGIFLPETVRGTPRVGTVINAGPGRITEKGIISSQIQPGQKVIYGAYAGTPYEINGEKVLLMREDEIILELNEEAS